MYYHLCSCTPQKNPFQYKHSTVLFHLQQAELKGIKNDLFPQLKLTPD